MSYQVNLEKFSGPLNLLLQLIEKKNLEITEISLSQVTQEYLSYFQEQQSVLPQELANFLVVASTLLLIKSKAILPTLELSLTEEEEILDLESRLRLLKFFKEKGEVMRKMFQSSYYLFSRSPWLEQKIQFSPPVNVNCQILAQIFKKTLEKFKIEKNEVITVKIPRLITLEERIKELISRLTKEKNFSLEAVTFSNKIDKIDFIVTFLAILHLAKEKIIKLKQDKHFKTIWITSK